MVALGIVIAAIAALLLLRVGAAAEYSDAGFIVVARVGFISFPVFPRKRRTERADKKREGERKKKPGGTTDYKKLIQSALSLPEKLRRRVLVKELTVHFTQGGGDAFTMAMGHGGISALMALTQAALESGFRVKRYDLRTSVDFLAEKPGVYAKAHLSISVAELIYLGIAVVQMILAARKPRKAPSDETKTPGLTR